MKKLLTLALVATSLATATAQPTKAKLDSLMDFYDREYHFNGVAQISWKGEILVEKGYGYKDVPNQIRNDKNTIFMIGSNTKQFTSEVVLMLIKENKMALEDKLSKYFPEYPSGDKITIKNLLTHTSGIFNYTEDTTRQTNMLRPMDRKSLMALFENKPLEFTPGDIFQYSNSNYILLGFIIEQITGKKYEQVVRDRILTPLGMSHSGFDYVHLQDTNKASGYYTIQGEQYNPAPVSDSTVTFAAGALYSNLTDLFKWHNALMNYTLLPKEWQEKAFVPFKGVYGYGWMIDTVYGKKTIGHTGGVPGFYTYEMRIPEDDVCILLLQNCLQPAMDNNTICVHILKAMYKSDYKLPEPKKFVTVDNNLLQQYTGVYQVMPGFTLTISVKENGLYAQGTDQDEFEMKAESEAKFYNKTVGAGIEFKKNESGKVTKLILSQGGQKIPASRI